MIQFQKNLHFTNLAEYIAFQITREHTAYANYSSKGVKQKITGTIILACTVKINWEVTHQD